VLNLVLVSDSMSISVLRNTALFWIWSYKHE
jgi:hypothetical protein